MPAGSTNFLQWNNPANNQETDAQYAADSLRAGGFGFGNLVPSVTLNKVLYQTTTFVAAFGQMMAAKGYTVTDSNITVLAAVLANIITSADQVPLLVTQGYSPTPAFNAAASSGFAMTLAGNITGMSISGQLAGQLLAFYFTQDSAGSRTVAWGANFYGFGQPDPTANATSLILARVDASGNVRAASPWVSNNGVYAPALVASSFTLTNPGSPGQVLTNVGGVFVPVSPNVVNATPAALSLIPNSSQQNTTGKPAFICGSLGTSGSSVGNIGVSIGPDASASAFVIWANEATATVNSGDAGFIGLVPTGWWFKVVTAGAVNGGVRNAAIIPIG